MIVLRKLLRYIEIFFGLIVAAVILGGCGHTPGAPVEQRGDLVVRGLLPDGSLADSVHIILDQDTLGYRHNPDTLTDLWAGIHWLEIKTVQIYQDSLLQYLSIPHQVQIGYSQITVATCSLTAEIPTAPYIGFFAPSFSAYDLDSSFVNMDSLAGRVRLIYFWSYG